MLVFLNHAKSKMLAHLSKKETELVVYDPTFLFYFNTFKKFTKIVTTLYIIKIIYSEKSRKIHLNIEEITA